MDVQRLRVLRELADRGSVTAVAAALSYTPSAISQQLKALTEEAGMPLTEPAGRSLRLTAAGHALVAETEAVFAALTRADAALERLRTTPTGVVNIAMFPSGARMLLAGLLHRLAATPGVEPRCQDVDFTPPEVPALTADFDVVVAHRDELAEPLAAAPRWEVVPLLREPLDVILPPVHPLAAQDAVALEELAGEAWITVKVGWPIDDVLRSLAVRTGTSPRVAHRIQDFAVTEELVAAGHGIALLPRYSTERHRLVRRRLAGVRAARLVEAVVRRSTAERPAVQAVLAALRAEAAAVVERG